MEVIREGNKTIYYCGKKQEDEKPVVKNKKIRKNEAEVSAPKPEEVING